MYEGTLLRVARPVAAWRSARWACIRIIHPRRGSWALAELRIISPENSRLFRFRDLATATPGARSLPQLSKRFASRSKTARTGRRKPLPAFEALRIGRGVSLLSMARTVMVGPYPAAQISRQPLRTSHQLLQGQDPPDAHCLKPDLPTRLVRRRERPFQAIHANVI